MKIAELVEKMDLTVFTGTENLRNMIQGGYVSDMLSDVMGNIDEGFVWVTIQNHKNVVAVATLKEAAAVILAKNIEPDEEMLNFAMEEGLPILGSPDQVFDITGKMYQLLNHS